MPEIQIDLTKDQIITLVILFGVVGLIIMMRRWFKK